MTFRSQDIDDLASKSSFEFSLCFRGCTTFAFAAPLFLFGLHLFWDCLLWGVAPPFINHTDIQRRRSRTFITQLIHADMRKPTQIHPKGDDRLYGDVVYKCLCLRCSLTTITCLQKRLSESGVVTAKGSHRASTCIWPKCWRMPWFSAHVDRKSSDVAQLSGVQPQLQWTVPKLASSGGRERLPSISMPASGRCQSALFRIDQLHLRHFEVGSNHHPVCRCV